MPTSIIKKPSLKEWLGLSALLTGTFILGLDIFVTDVCVPNIVKDLGISSGEASYIVTIYMVMTASFIILCGKVGDIIGARKTFILSILGFGLASIVTAVAGNLMILLLGRLLQAISFAFAIPASMSLLNHLFPGGQSRVFVFSLWTMVVGSAVAIGPLLGGFFVDWFTWRWAFMVNVPFALLSVLGVYWNIEPIKNKYPEKNIDLLGALFLILGISAIIFGFQASANWGWFYNNMPIKIFGQLWPFSCPPTLCLIIFGAGCIYYFSQIEKKREAKGLGVILGMKLLNIPSFSWGTIVASLMTGSIFGVMFILPLYSAYVLNETALLSGVLLLPLGIGMAVGGPLTSFRDITTLKRYLPGLLLMQLLGFIGLFFCISEKWHELFLSGTLLLLGLSWGASYAVLVNILLADVPKAFSGVAGGAQIMGRLLCGALATALMTSVLVNTMQHEYFQQVNMQQIKLKSVTKKQAQELKQLERLKRQLSKQRIFANDSMAKRIKSRNFNKYIKEIKDDMILAFRGTMGVALVFALFAFLSAIRLRRLHKRQI